MSRTHHAVRAIALIVALSLMVSVSGCGGKRDSRTSPASTAARRSGEASVTASTTGAPTVTRPSSADVTAAPASSLQPPAYEGYQPLPIFTYHSVDPTKKSDITITPQQFEEQLRLIKSLGYTTITARQLAEYHEKGTALPAKPVMITFDDGWKNQFTYAAPLLEKYGMTAVFFIYPKMIGGGGAFMKKDQVAALDARGFDIESHTWGHVPLVRKGDNSLKLFEHWTRSQYTQTDAWFVKVLGKKPLALAYPYGFYDLETVGITRSHGMQLGFTIDEGTADARAWDRMALKRYTVYANRPIEEFRRRLTSTPLPARDIQPPPGTRVVGRDATLTVDITALPANVKNVAFASGRSIGKTTIVTKGGRRYAVSTLHGTNAGFRNVTLRGTGPDGRRYVTAWGLVMGN